MIYREIHSASGECDVMKGLGRNYQNLNQTERTLTYFDQAMAVFRNAKDPVGEANVLNASMAIFITAPTAPGQSATTSRHWWLHT